MPNTSMNIRMDSEVKKQAEQIFNELGVNMTTAINIFLKHAIREHGIPFLMKLNFPNAETIAAIEESERILRDPNTKRYSKFSEILEEVKQNQPT